MNTQDIKVSFPDRYFMAKVVEGYEYLCLLKNNQYLLTHDFKQSVWSDSSAWVDNFLLSDKVERKELTKEEAYAIITMKELVS